MKPPETLIPLKLEPNDQLRWLRAFDGSRQWKGLSDHRQCQSCGRGFTGNKVKFVGGIKSSGPVRAICPTRDCLSGPLEWLHPHEVAGGGPVAVKRASRVSQPAGENRVLDRLRERSRAGLRDIFRQLQRIHPSAKRRLARDYFFCVELDNWSRTRNDTKGFLQGSLFRMQAQNS